MASLPLMSVTLGSCISSNKIRNTKPYIAQLHKNRHFSNLIDKRRLFPLALMGQKKPIELWKKYQSEKWKARSGVAPESSQPLSREMKAVQDFYHAFNAKEIDTLKQLLSPNCVYQDFLFYTPYEGIESIISLWKNVMDAMGSSIQVKIQHIKDDDHLMATVIWHLEWRDKKIPFTNGCRFFTFEEVEERLVISKITGLEELPLKPGELALKMLQAVRVLLDSYPPGATAALALLESHVLQDGNTNGETRA